MKFFNKHRLVIKVLLGTLILWGIPVAIISNFAFQHLQTIKNISLQEARAALISSQISHLENHLAQQADKISTEFSNIKDDVRFFGSLAAPIVAAPTRFHFRSGSRYEFDEDGVYGNSSDDGHSRLFVPAYLSALDPLIAATENLDNFLRPLSETKKSIVLGWFIHKDGISRTYPWRDFKLYPRDREATSWPFYFLAGPEHNPSRGEVFTPLYIDPLTRDRMISCLSPVFAGDDHVATVGIDITVQKIIEDISQVRLTENSSSFLLSDQEILAASENLPLAAMGLSPEDPPHGLNLTLAELSEAGKTILGEKREGIGIELIQIGESQVFMGYASLDPLGWRLFLLVPEDDLVGPADERVAAIFQGAERIRSNFLHILVFAMLAIMSVGWLVIAQQSKGLRTLLGGIREFAKGNLKHQISEEKSEFGELARALNTMAMSLLEKKKELQRAHAEVEQGRKLTAVGRLAAGVAHEVNNPLATISTYTQLLLRSEPRGETAARLKKIMGEIDRIQEKMRNLLDLSRLQSPVRKKTDPNLLVSDITDLACHEARALGIDLRLCLTENSHEISLDRSGFKQVLWNLLGNAFAAQGAGGKVRVSTRFFTTERGPELFTLVVEDEGPGISEEVLPHIFDPFFTTKEFGQGTGLGLAVVNSIVEGHGGRIGVQNLSPRGCCFEVIFPVGGKE